MKAGRCDRGGRGGHCLPPGDYESAIDTLKMVITLIKQSVTAGSEASQVTTSTISMATYSLTIKPAIIPIKVMACIRD